MKNKEEGQLLMHKENVLIPKTSVFCVTRRFLKSSVWLLGRDHFRVFWWFSVILRLEFGPEQTR